MQAADYTAIALHFSAAKRRFAVQNILIANYEIAGTDDIFLSADDILSIALHNVKQLQHIFMLV